MENSRIDLSSESGSISDGTLIFDDYNDHFTSVLNTKPNVMSKINDYDFYNYNYNDHPYIKTNNTNDISRNATMTYTENYDESSYDSDLTHKNSTGTLISLSSVQFSKNQNNVMNKKDTTDELFNRFEKESLVINKMLEEINNDDDDDDDDDEVDSDINKILYIPSDTQRKLCLSPLQSKIKANIDESQEEEKNNAYESILDSMSQSDNKRYSKNPNKRINHKKCQSDGSYLAFKTKNKNNIKEEKEELSELKRRNHIVIKNNQKENVQGHRESSFSDNHRNSNVSDSRSEIHRSHSLKDCPPIPPRGISIVHMKNRMRKNVKSENLGKQKKDSIDKNDFFRTLPMNKPVTCNTDFNTLLKRRYRENRIKILYRTDYYMQNLDDTDYESYDKALFDDQLFINVENNETDCSKEISKTESEEESKSLLTNPLDLLSKRKRNPNIISPLYQQLVDRIHKNKKEREKMEEEIKRKEKEKKLLLSPDYSLKNNKESLNKSYKSQNKSHRYAIADFNNILSSLKNKSFQSSKDNISEHSNETLLNHHSNGIISEKNTNGFDSRNVKKCKSCSHLSSLSNSNSISSSSSTSSSKYYSNQSTPVKRGSDSVSLKSSSSNYAQPTDYYKQYNADKSDYNIYRKASYQKHFYPYQTPTYDDYCHGSASSSLLSLVNSSNTSLNSNYLSEANSSDSSLTATDHTYKGCLGKDFTSYYNYNKTYNLPYTSGIDVLDYY